MLLLTGVLLLCGSLIALVWAYEVNRRPAMPRWGRVELLWEILLASVIGVAMIGSLLVLKYILHVHRAGSIDAVQVIASLAAIGATIALCWYLLRPLRALRVIDGGLGEPVATGGRPAARRGHAPRKAA
ncbi:hypothetical protein SAMN06265365_12119 [Tistlia consotensis]|uniref:Uncharacterized protein n=1 Tax=Tistlia consotensis USBA 355 TaxID=560819 RepID=A0A1Y6CFP8_9PROT|nr:hypothetical protein [Tistlia consotensis]SMF60884.1 hypothetical protein SAMN05428998_123104 [Tistlia consotensis USBA 355]SNR92559.1 hypothetical protein SAMN06265365_12119 [Tistlia consotensis]